MFGIKLYTFITVILQHVSKQRLLSVAPKFEALPLVSRARFLGCSTVPPKNRFQFDKVENDTSENEKQKYFF